MNEHHDLRKFHLIAAIVSAGVIGSLFIYVLIVEMIKLQNKPFLGFAKLENAGWIRYVFYGFAVIQVVVIRFLRGVLLRKLPSDDSATLSRKLFRTSVLTSALSEVPAILGLVLFLMSGLYLDFYILSFVSLFLLFMFFPRHRNWTAWLQNQA